METPTVQISRFNIPAPLAVAAWVGFGVPVFIWTVESFRATVGGTVTVTEPSTGSGDYNIPPGTPPALVGPIINEQADSRPLPLVERALRFGIRLGGDLSKLNISIPFA